MERNPKPVIGTSKPASDYVGYLALLQGVEIQSLGFVGREVDTEEVMADLGEFEVEDCGSGVDCDGLCVLQCCCDDDVWAVLVLGG